MLPVVFCFPQAVNNPVPLIHKHSESFYYSPLNIHGASSVSKVSTGYLPFNDDNMANIESCSQMGVFFMGKRSLSGGFDTINVSVCGD